MELGVGKDFPDPSLLVHGHFVVKQVEFGKPLQPAERWREVTDQIGPKDEPFEVCHQVDVLGYAFDFIVREVEFPQR